jgi:hypothetical protein
MMSQTVIEIPRSSLADLAAASAKVTGVQHLASYDWLEKPVPTISIPGKMFLAIDIPAHWTSRSNKRLIGSPPLWSPPSRASSTYLPQDSGMVYID